MLQWSYGIWSSTITFWLPTPGHTTSIIWNIVINLRWEYKLLKKILSPAPGAFSCSRIRILRFLGSIFVVASRASWFNNADKWVAPGTPDKLKTSARLRLWRPGKSFLFDDCENKGRRSRPRGRRFVIARGDDGWNFTTAYTYADYVCVCGFAGFGRRLSHFTDRRLAARREDLDRENQGRKKPRSLAVTVWENRERTGRKT